MRRKLKEATTNKRGPVPITEIIFDKDDADNDDAETPSTVPASTSTSATPLRRKKAISKTSAATATTITPSPPSTDRTTGLSKISIVALVDHWYKKVDIKTCTLADIYKKVEGHFQVVLNKKERKIVRRRLRELNGDEGSVGNLSGKSWKNKFGRGENRDAGSTGSNSEEILFFDESHSSISVQKLFREYSKTSVDGSNHSSPMNVTRSSHTSSKRRGRKDEAPLESVIEDDAAEFGNEDYTDDDDFDDSASGASSLDETASAHISQKMLRRDSNRTPRRGRKPERDEGELKVKHDTAFWFHNLSYVVGLGDRQRHILRDVNGFAYGGEMLGIMSPFASELAKVIEVLSLEADARRIHGNVSINQQPLDTKVFRDHAFIVHKHDIPWPNLRCRDVLQYASELYGTRGKDPSVHTAKRMGLFSSMSVKVSDLTDAQRVRLSIAVALLKRPTLLILEGPTTDLGPAEASMLMQDLSQAARDDGFIVICTIVHPSTRIFNHFDRTLILSKGRTAYFGQPSKILSYFAQMDFECPRSVGAAEFVLDLLNASFSEHDLVNKILQHWAGSKEQKILLSRLNRRNEEGVVKEDPPESKSEGSKSTSNTTSPPNFVHQFFILLRRHCLIAVRGMSLYVHRSVLILVLNSLLAVSVWNGRNFEQENMYTKTWLALWLIFIPCICSSLIILPLQIEFSVISKEAKNGMVNGLPYALARTFLVMPIVIFLALCAIGVPGYVIQEFPLDTLGTITLLVSACLYVFESSAECLSVWITAHTINIVCFATLLLASIWFSGIVQPLENEVWPFKVLAHVLPLRYFLRSFMYTLVENLEFETCSDPSLSAVCAEDSSRSEVLDAMAVIFHIFETDDSIIRDVIVMVGIASVFKIMYIAGVLVKIGV